MTEPRVRASRMLRLRARFRRVPRTVDLSTWAEPRIQITGYDVPKRELVSASLLAAIGGGL